jgi:predicted ferric reductase
VNPQLAWYLARAAGVVAWLLVSAAVVWGLLLSIRIAERPPAKWLLDLHRFLGGAAVAFTAIHMVALVADSYVHFDVVDLLVPFASGWKPGAVALGIVTFWLLAAVEVSSLLMRRLPRRVWHAVHATSYVVFWAGTLHGITAGTDASHPLFVVTANLLGAIVVFLTLVRVLSPRRRRALSVVRPVDRSMAA